MIEGSASIRAESLGRTGAQPSLAVEVSHSP